MTEELHASLDWSGLMVLDEDECYELLRGQPVGRLGFIDKAEPVILPVNYAVDGRSLVFRTGQGSKLSSALMAQPVCLEIDSWDDFEHTGWSVLVKGVADVVEAEADVDRLDHLPVRPWSRPDLRHEWVRIMAEEVTGRRIAPHASSEPVAE
jgi:nitroimidazol reductase NimA-like FMN-containing flavoprotein (pyridoxamine 5'-phosphate oxidase superfamily)